MSYWTGQRVIVSGGAGFLGTHVVERLRDAGCIDIFIVRSRDYDLTKEEHVARLFSDLSRGLSGWSTTPDRPPADVVIHLAGLVGGIGANKARPVEFFYQNLMMGTLMLHYSWKFGASKFLAAGAGCGYPEHAPMPLKEQSFWDGFPQQESAPYSLAKRMLHVQSMAYWRQHAFPAVVAVPGNIYGPYDNFDLENGHVIPALVRKFVQATDEGSPTVTIWGTGAPTRDFVYAGDVAEGMLRAAEVYDQSELVNLSSGSDTSIREVVQTLAELTEFRGEIVWDTTQPDGQARRRFDISKARTELDFQARTTFREGLRRTVEWYRAHRADARMELSFAAGRERAAK